MLKAAHAIGQRPKYITDDWKLSVHADMHTMTQEERLHVTSLADSTKATAAVNRRAKSDAAVVRPALVDAVAQSTPKTVTTLALASTASQVVQRDAPSVCDWLESAADCIPSAGAIPRDGNAKFPLSSSRLQAHTSSRTYGELRAEFKDNVSVIGSGSIKTRSEPFPARVRYAVQCGPMCRTASNQRDSIMSSMIRKGLDMYRSHICKACDVPLHDILLAWEFSAEPSPCMPGVVAAHWCAGSR